jgi:sortase A
MNKVKPAWSKFSILSLGFMILGIGCISWAIFSLLAQSDYFVNTSRNHYSVPTAITTKQNKVTADDSAPLESDPSHVLSIPGKSIYSVYPSEGDNIGSLTIPALKQEFPILQGTDGPELQDGVGHFAQSVLPGEEDNCVLSGHRETVFRQLGNLKIGDQLIVQTSAGTFTYEVKGTRIVPADDKTVIVPTDHAVLTLTTCYPFDTPGYFPDRYIVSAALVKSEYAVKAKQNIVSVK